MKLGAPAPLPASCPWNFSPARVPVQIFVPGHGKQFLSRQGNLYHAPTWFVEGLPAVPLDGELWIERKKFQRTVSIVRRQDKSDLCRLLVRAPFPISNLPQVFAMLGDILLVLDALVANGLLGIRGLGAK